MPNTQIYSRESKLARVFCWLLNVGGVFSGGAFDDALFGKLNVSRETFDKNRHNIVSRETNSSKFDKMFHVKQYFYKK